MSRRKVALAALAVVLASCEEAGTFSVEFRFEEPPTLPTTTYAYAKVELPEAPERLIAAGPSIYGPGATLAFPSVPNGEGRVVQVELRDNGGEGAQVLYYGRSEPFAIKPNQNVVVPVAMKLRAAPASGPASGGVKIVSHLGSGYVSSERVAIELYAPKGAKKALLSNEPTVPAESEQNTVEIAADGAVSAPEGFVGVRHEGWELATCPERSECVRTVYAWFVDENGVRSRATSGQVIVDRIEPKAVSASANRAELKRGEELTIAVQASEPLLGDGTKSAITAAVYRAGETTPVEGFALSLVEGTQYVFRHEVTASDVDGAYEAAFTFTDRAGNEGKSERVKFAVDSVAPVVTLEMPARTRFSAQTGFETLELKASATEAWTKLVATVGGRAMACVESGLAATCRFTVTTDLKASDGTTLLSAIEEEGESVQVRVEDAAGNTGEASASVVFDLKAPSATLRSAKQRHKRGDVVSVQVQASEQLEGATSLNPRVSGPGAMALGYVAGTNYLYEHALTASDVDGAYAVDFTIVDRAGNTGASDVLSVEVDQQVPVVTIAANRTRFSAVEGFRSVEVSVAVSKDVATPTATIGGRPMDCGPATTARSFTCRFGVTASLRTIDGAAALDTVEEDLEAVVVAVADAFGNAAQASTNVTFDLKAPRATVRSAKTKHKQGDTVSVQVQPSEPLDGAASLTPRINGPSRVSLGYVEGTSYQFEHLLTPLDADGTYRVGFDLVDRVGNVGSSDAVMLAVDQIPPLLAVTTNDTIFSAARGREQVLVRVTASKPVNTPTVTIGGRPADCGRFELASAFNCRYEVTADLAAIGGARRLSEVDQELEAVVATASDEFGNAAQVSTNVVFDLKAPTAEVIAEPIYGRWGRVRFEVLPSEAVFSADDITPDVASAGAQALAMTYVPPTRYAFEHLLEPADVDGDYLAKFRIRDLAGNEGETTAVRFTIDQTPPQLTLTGPTRTRFSASAGFRRVEVAVAATKDVRITSALVGGRAMACLPAAIGRSFTCSYDLSTTELAQDGRTLLETLDEESEALVISALDAAGNAARAQTTVVFDAKPPSATLRAAALVKKGGVVSVLVQPSEPLESSAAIMPLVTPPGGAAPFGLSYVAGTNYLFEHALAPADADGTYELKFAVTDRAGNTATSERVEWVVDQTPPVLTLAPFTRTRFSAETGFRDVSVGVTLDDPAATVSATVGGRAMACAASDTVRVCTYRLLARELSADGVHFIDELEDEPQSILVTATDLAGNTVQNGAGVVFDQRPPAVSSATVAYEAAITNPLSNVTKATNGTTIRVNALFSEAVDTTPTMTATLGVTTLVFTLDAATSSGARFAHVVAGNPADGLYAPAIALADLAGNRATASFAAPTIDVKTSTPALSVIQANVRYLRSPWGRADVESLGTTASIPAGPYFALVPADPLSAQGSMPAATFALGSSAPAMLRVWGDGARTTYLGATKASSDGAWPRVTLIPVDVPAAFVSGVDAAGNESPAVKITQAQWVGSTNMPTSGSPHGLTSTSNVVPVAVQEAERTLPEKVGAGGVDGTAVRALGEAAWRARATEDLSPAARSRHAMAYDSRRGRTVLFGGSTVVRSYAADTWEWDGQAWIDRTPTRNSPPGRIGAAMVYDAARDRVVLFGGADALGVRADTWEWDGEAWIDRTPSGASGPDARVGHRLIYDSLRKRVILFGGAKGTPTNSTKLGDAWAWDGEAWRLLAPAGAGPAARSGHLFTYDEARDRAVLFGGIGSGVLGLSDTWEWDGAAWTQKASAGGPSNIYDAASAFDPKSARTVMVGGYRAVFAFSGSVDQVWSWDGTSWTDVVSTRRPSARTGAAAVFDRQRARFILFGGDSGTVSPTRSSDTWSWDGAKWLDVTPSSVAPTRRFEAALAYDELNGATVLFGGVDVPGTRLADTWLWDGMRWTLLPAGSQQPSGRASSGIAFDPVAGKTVLFGGAGISSVALDDMWAFDGSSWAPIPAAGTWPMKRAGHAMVWDSARQRLTMVSGGSYDPSPGDVWQWDESSWTRLSGTSAIGYRSSFALGFDPNRGKTVLYGGGVFSNSKPWEWDGASWTEVSPAGPIPSKRDAATMAFDPVRKRLLIFGGSVGLAINLRELLSWDGTRLRDVTPLRWGPAAQSGAKMVYDTARSRLVLFSTDAETWELDADPARQPAIQLDVDGSSIGVPVSAVQGLRARAWCGGRYSDGAARNGATLMAWTDERSGSWSELATNVTGVGSAQPYLPGASALLDWSAASPAEARSLITERDKLLALQCRPAGSTGTGDDEAVVALDYAEVRIDYDAP